MVQNALTIDVEDWYQTMDLNIDVKDWDNYEDRIERNIERLLELLEKNKVRATFFVLGYIAKAHPKMIRKIQLAGHEIGSHGFSHRLVYSQTRNLFRQDINISKKIIEDIIGQEVNIFRASSWSISKKTLWALEILEEEGFICDSSIQPFITPLSGINGAPNFPFHPVINNKKLNMLEFPPSVLNCGGIKVPFAGGLYLRTFPISFIKYALNKVNNKTTGLIYTHPWEIDVDQPRLSVPLHIKFTHYYNINTTINKIELLLKNFKFTTIGNIIKENNYPYSQI